MERFLERLSASKYHDNFIIKGGILVTAMVGIPQRSTMDIDTSIRNENMGINQKNWFHIGCYIVSSVGKALINPRHQQAYAPAV